MSEYAALIDYLQNQIPEQQTEEGRSIMREWIAALSAPAPQGIGREEIARVIDPVFEYCRYRSRDALAKADAILAFLPAEPPAQWQPIETAPRDGWEILIGWAGGDVAVGWFETSRGHFNWHEASRPKTMQPTHWMRLPKPPAQGEVRHD